MKRVIIAAAAAALLALAVPASPVGAQATTDVYAVHGLNLAGQSSADQGGTPVTVCAGATEIDVTSSSATSSARSRSRPGPRSPCRSTAERQRLRRAGVGEALIDQAVTPTGAAVALVATAFGNPLVPELLPFPIDLSCVDPGNGGAVAAHAANAPRVDVVNTTLGFSIGEISYGEQIAGQLPVGDYDVEVFVVGESTPVADYTAPVTEGNTTIGYAVGNQPGDGPGTPIVFITQVIPVGTCEAPTTTTTAPPATAPPAAAPATAQPAFTG